MGWFWWEHERTRRQKEFWSMRMGAHWSRHRSTTTTPTPTQMPWGPLRRVVSQRSFWPSLLAAPAHGGEKKKNPDMPLRIAVHSWTENAIRLEVSGLSYPTTVHDMIVAVAESASVLYHHSTGMATTLDSVVEGGREQAVDGQDGKKRQLTSVLKELLTDKTLLDRKIESWQDAKEVLSHALQFPPEQVQQQQQQEEEGGEGGEEEGEEEGDVEMMNQDDAGGSRTSVLATPSSLSPPLLRQTRTRKIPPHGVHSPMRRSAKKYETVEYRQERRASTLFGKWRKSRSAGWRPPSVSEYRERIMRATLQIRGMAPPQMRWKQIIHTPMPASPLTAVRPSEEELQENIEKLKEETALDDDDDKKKVRSKEELDKALADRDEAKERERQSQKAASLLRPLTADEKEIVRSALYSDGREDQVLAQSDTGDSVQRRTLQTLRPGCWVNDEVIHYFLYTLSQRDAEWCAAQPGRRRCHFFKSFFLTKLYDEGGSGAYRYANVKRWSKKVPGHDLFALGKIFFPVNLANTHWACAVADLPQRRIQFYDSMHGRGNYHLEGIWRYLQDEHQAKKACPLPDKDAWKLVECSPDTPQQTNGFDCGVFTCMFADFLSRDCPLSFSQEDIPQCRERIALSIMKGRAID